MRAEDQEEEEEEEKEKSTSSNGFYHLVWPRPSRAESFIKMRRAVVILQYLFATEQLGRLAIGKRATINHRQHK